MCEGPDLNRGTPAGTDLESVAFDRAWLPSLGPPVRLGAILKARRPEHGLHPAAFWRSRPRPNLGFGQSKAVGRLQTLKSIVRALSLADGETERD